MADTGNMSGQAGGGGDSVFGGLGGGQQQGSDLPQMPDGPRNAGGHPTGNPSGGDGGMSAAPPLDSVFGTDLGGSGISRETGGSVITNAVPSSGPPGQGGR